MHTYHTILRPLRQLPRLCAISSQPIIGQPKDCKTLKQPPRAKHSHGLRHELVQKWGKAYRPTFLFNKNDWKK